MSLDLHLEAALYHRVPSELSERTLRELVDLYWHVRVRVYRRSVRWYARELQHYIPPIRVPGYLSVEHHMGALHPNITHLGEVELERIISTQADVKSHLEEVRQWIPLVGEEKGIVTQRAHG